MLTYCIAKMITTRSPMVGQLFDAMIAASCILVRFLVNLAVFCVFFLISGDFGDLHLIHCSVTV